MNLNSDRLAKLLEKAGLPVDPSQAIGRKVCVATQTDKSVPDAREFIFSTIASISFHQAGRRKSAEPTSPSKFGPPISNLCIALSSGRVVGGRTYSYLEFNYDKGWVAHVGPYRDDASKEVQYAFLAEVTILD